MSIEYRSEKKWRFRITYEGKNYSTNYFSSIAPLFNSKDKPIIPREVKSAHDEFKVDIERGKIGTDENMKFFDLAQLCYDEYFKIECKVSTQNNYKNILNNHIVPYFGKIKISSIKPIDIQKFTNRLNTNLKPNTVNGIVGVLTKIFSLAEEWGLINSSPCGHVRKPARERKGGTELMPMHEIGKLFEIFDQETNLMHKAAFYLAICCGLRNSEIRALTTDDIDFKNNTINVNKQIGEKRQTDGTIKEDVITTKTKSSNSIIYAPEFVMDVLKEYITELPYIPISKQIFWSHITRNPITKHCLSKRFARVLENNNLTQIRFHDLRHLHATLLIGANVDVQTVAKRMRHSNARTTMESYIHSLDAIEKKSAAELENFINDLMAK